MHLLGKEGLGPARDGFPISNYVVYKAVMAVGVGIIYNSFDFATLFLCYWQLMYVLHYTLKVSDYHGDLWLFPDTSVVGYHTAHTHYLSVNTMLLHNLVWPHPQTKSRGSGCKPYYDLFCCKNMLQLESYCRAANYSIPAM